MADKPIVSNQDHVLQIQLIDQVNQVVSMGGHRVREFIRRRFVTATATDVIDRDHSLLLAIPLDDSPVVKAPRRIAMHTNKGWLAIGRSDIGTREVRTGRRIDVAQGVTVDG